MANTGLTREGGRDRNQDAIHDRARRMIPLPLQHLDASGRVWHPYSVEFDSPDGAYSVYLYAISWEHAQLQLDALRETGRVTGEVCGVVGNA